MSWINNRVLPHLSGTWVSKPANPRTCRGPCCSGPRRQTTVAGSVSGTLVPPLTGGSRAPGLGQGFPVKVYSHVSLVREHSTPTLAERCALRLFLFKLVSGAFLLWCSAAVFDRLIMRWSVAIWLVVATRTMFCIGAVASRSRPCESMEGFFFHGLAFDMQHSATLSAGT